MTPTGSVAGDAAAESPPVSPAIPTTLKTETEQTAASGGGGPEPTSAAVVADSEDTATGGDPNNREFICMNDEFSECMTGQYTLKLARKVISNYFGRNKASTRIITDWPLFCRKHYQRATYKPELWQRRKIDLIARQLNVIEDARPGTTYTISLKKSEDARLSLYARLADQKVPHEKAALAAGIDEKNKAFQAPINVLREMAEFLGSNKTKDQAGELVNLILEMLKGGEISQVPSFELLLEIPDDVTPKSTPTKAKSTKASPRVSSKGAVKKPRKN